MRRHVRWLGLALGGLAALTLLLSYALPVARAQTCTPADAPCLRSVSPTAVANTFDVTIVINGEGFDATGTGFRVVLYYGGNPVRDLTIVNVIPTTITAVVPAGLPGAINGLPYQIRVWNGPAGLEIMNGFPLTLLILVPAPPTTTSTVTPSPTLTSTPTHTPTYTPTPFIRPIVTVLSYGASSRVLTPGQEIDIEMTVQNTGALTARNVLVAFGEGDLVPRETGGLRALGDIAPGGTVRFWQPLRVNSTIAGYEAVINIEIRYTDEFGNPYTDRSTLSFEARVPGATRTPSPTPTATGTLSVRPLVLIEGFDTVPETLTPGTVFDLNVHVINASGEVARQVIVTLQTGGAGQQAGQAASSDIAPTTGSVRYVEQMSPGERVPLTFEMAVNGDAEGGLAPMTIQLSYMDNYNVQHTDTQTISLAVNATPFLQIGLFEPLPEFISVGDTFELPVEVINMGTQTVNLSTVEVVGDSRVTIQDGSLYIGPLDAGTSGSLVALVTAHQAGAIPLEVRAHYLNSFQQPEVLTEIITIQVEAIPEGGVLPNGEIDGRGGGQDAGEDDGEVTLGERLLRALLGFLGLGTRDPQTTIQNVPGARPADEEPVRIEVDE